MLNGVILREFTLCYFCLCHSVFMPLYHSSSFV